MVIQDDEVAAAIAAVSYVLERGELVAPQPPERSAWHTAAVLEAQGLPPVRSGAYGSWSTAERARRAHRWSYGIVGM
jgi:hypothetical protein